MRPRGYTWLHMVTHQVTVESPVVTYVTHKRGGLRMRAREHMFLALEIKLIIRLFFVRNLFLSVTMCNHVTTRLSRGFMCNRMCNSRN